MVDDLLERIMVDLIFVVEETVHLVHNVLGQINNPSDDIKELIEHLECPTNLQLHLTRYSLSILVLFKHEA